MTRRIKLDRIDRRILRDLQDDGRMTNVDLAHRAGISAPPCLRRVRALEEAGYIKGYHAFIDPESMGFGVTVFAHVGLESQPRPISRRSRIWSLPGRRCARRICWRARTDFLLKIVAADWDSYHKFLTTRLTSAPNVSHVKSALAIRRSKFEPGVPIDVEVPDEH